MFFLRARRGRSERDRADDMQEADVRRTRIGFRSPRRKGMPIAPAIPCLWLICSGLAATRSAPPPGERRHLRSEPSEPSTLSFRTSVVAFVNVNVVPMDRERVVENQTVVVRGSRIAAIGRASDTSVPEGALRIDARGKYLMPGLAEMHAHVPGANAPPGFAERVLFLYLANGITTIRGMLGHPRHLELRERLARGEVPGPRLITSGPSLNGNSIPNPDTARRAVLHQKAAGYDFLKIHPGITRAAYDAVDAAADEVGIPFAGHVPADVGLMRALEAGQASIDHLDGYMQLLVPEDAPVERKSAAFFGFNLVEHVDESKIPALAAATRKAGVWNVPTQALVEELAGGLDPEVLARRPDLRYMPREVVSSWANALSGWKTSPNIGYTPERGRRFLEVRRKLIKALHDAGAGLLLGSDAPQLFNVPGFSIHEELRALAAAGLSPYEALETGTRNVAAFFGELDERGTVESGKIADLVLLGGNPLESLDNVRRIEGVMRDGRWLPGSEIRRRLEAIAAANRTEGE